MWSARDACQPTRAVTSQMSPGSVAGVFPGRYDCRSVASLKVIGAVLVTPQFRYAAENQSLSRTIGPFRLGLKSHIFTSPTRLVKPSDRSRSSTFISDWKVSRE